MSKRTNATVFKSGQCDHLCTFSNISNFRQTNSFSTYNRKGYLLVWMEAESYERALCMSSVWISKLGMSTRYFRRFLCHCLNFDKTSIICHHLVALLALFPGRIACRNLRLTGPYEVWLPFHDLAHRGSLQQQIYKALGYNERKLCSCGSKLHSWCRSPGPRLSILRRQNLNHNSK